MSEDNELRHVVGTIYDAALNPALWPDTLATIAAFVGGSAGPLNPKDLVSKFVGTEDHFGLDHADLDLRYMQMHAQTGAGFDPLATQPVFDVGQILDFPGCGGVAGAVIERPKKSCALRDVVPSEANNIADAEMRRRMTLVAPHARRAILIGKALDQKADEAAIFADILDSLSAGFFLIDAGGRIIHANAAGRGILGADDFLRSIGGRLVVRDKKVNQTLQRIFADKDDLEPDCEIGGKGIALPLMAEDGEYHIAHVLPLGPRDDAPGAAAAVYVTKATLETPSSAEVIRRAYQLTRTELRVLLAIVNVGGIREVATALGVADCTVKTHIRRLLEKTGAGRQTDLIKLVAGFFTPLVA
jgi:DNA-binding CsgD family transcriptional regulator/PAS domain-containing protein